MNNSKYEQALIPPDLGLFLSTKTSIIDNNRVIEGGT